MQNTFQSHVSTYLDATSQEFFVFVFASLYYMASNTGYFDTVMGLKKLQQVHGNTRGVCEFYL